MSENGVYIAEQALLRDGETIYDKPITYEYDVWNQDVKSHTENQVPCGFVSPNNNPIAFKKVQDGRIFMNVVGKIWKRYAKNLMEVLKRDIRKAVSLEIEVLDFDEETFTINKFSILGITILGREILPAIKDANLTVLSFSKDKESYYQKFEDKNVIDINNSKEASMDSSSWVNPGRKLYSILLSKKNKISLLNEAYLVVDKSKVDESPSEALKYPHHSIKNGELVVNVKGIQSAFSRARQQNIATGEVLAHIQKHYKELKLDMGNFSTEIEKEENELKDEKVIMEDEKKEEVEMAVEDEKKEEVKEEPKEEEKMAVEEDKKEEEKEEDFGCGKEEYEKKISEFSTKIEAYEKELEGLRKFKSDREEQDKLFALEQLFSEVKESLSKDKLEEFRTRSEELKFSDVPAFSNEVKAATFDVVKKVSSEDTIKRMATTVPVQEKKKNPFW
jgi:hypothetical protein